MFVAARKSEGNKTTMSERKIHSEDWIPRRLKAASRPLGPASCVPVLVCTGLSQVSKRTNVHVGSGSAS